MTCVIHMLTHSQVFDCSALLSCTKHIRCQSGLIANHGSLFPVAGVLNGVTGERQDSPCMYLAHYKPETVNNIIVVTGSYLLP